MEAANPTQALQSSDYCAVTTFEEISRLSSVSPVLLFATRAERGQGESNQRRHFEERILPRVSKTIPTREDGILPGLAKAVPTRGIAICWSNVGGLFHISPLAMHLARHKVRASGCFLFQDGHLVAHVPVSWLPEDEEYIQAAKVVTSELSEHTRIPPEVKEVAYRHQRQQRITALLMLPISLAVGAFGILMISKADHWSLFDFMFDLGIVFLGMAGGFLFVFPAEVIKKASKDVPFYLSLFPECGSACKHEGCRRLAVAGSAHCARHHFESVRGEEPLWAHAEAKALKKKDANKTPEDTRC